MTKERLANASRALFLPTLPALGNDVWNSRTPPQLWLQLNKALLPNSVAPYSNGALSSCWNQPCKSVLPNICATPASCYWALPRMSSRASQTSLAEGFPDLLHKLIIPLCFQSNLYILYIVDLTCLDLSIPSSLQSSVFFVLVAQCLTYKLW